MIKIKGIKQCKQIVTIKRYDLHNFLIVTRMDRGGLMAREKRGWFPGVMYHIMSRGNDRQNIFED